MKTQTGIFVLVSEAKIRQPFELPEIRQYLLKNITVDG
jgi:hypothetical protein